MGKTSKILAVLLGVACFVTLVQGVVIFNLSRLNRPVELHAKLLDAPMDSDEDTLFENRRREVRTRAALYNQLIERDMLVEGMVVNRNAEGKSIHICDSLLFSSLRYRSLVALQFDESAEKAWAAIQSSRDRGHWWRHPLCNKKSLSRDMLMGVMIALDASPPNARGVLLDLLREINYRRGSFSDGPFFVSYLSPGPAGLLRNYAESYKIPYKMWPWVLKQSFSSVEYDTMFLKPGFESHLAALGLWLEHKFLKQETGFNPRSLLGQVDRFLTNQPAHQTPDLDIQRMRWVANTIAQESPRNLFFTILQLDIEGQLSDRMKSQFMAELLEMPQFPSDRLPSDCDKDADYLWQRRTEEYDAKTSKCRITYSGVDYLWVAGLLAGDY